MATTMIAEHILQEQDTIEWLPVTSIEIDRSYQRYASSHKIKLISASFDKNACGVLIVSKRDNGQYFVVDGQHRLEAMKKNEMLLAPCQVCQGLTIQQEAELFIHCNTVRKTPEALDVFKSRLIAQEPVALAIHAIVEQHGLHVQFNTKNSRGGTREPQGIWAVAALEVIYKRGKESLLEEVLNLLLHSWPQTPMALEAKVLLGVMHFHLKYLGKYTREDFIAKMSVTDLKSLYRRAQYHADNGGHGSTAFAKALQEAYDKGRKTTRLEKKILD